jgi:hypothetical protein
VRSLAGHIARPLARLLSTNIDPRIAGGSANGCRPAALPAGGTAARAAYRCEALSERASWPACALAGSSSSCRPCAARPASSVACSAT